jgi:hypothetical protein
MRAKTLVSGQASQTTKNVPNANTVPATSAPPKRIPSSRPRNQAPRAPTNSLRAATTASDFQNGSTSAGQVNGEKIADCALARKGRPPIRCGFHSGTSGRASRVNSKKGWNTATASAISKFVPSGGTPSGRITCQGVIDQSPSELDSVRPGSRPCPTISSDRRA